MTLRLAPPVFLQLASTIQKPPIISSKKCQWLLTRNNPHPRVASRLTHLCTMVLIQNLSQMLCSQDLHNQPSNYPLELRFVHKVITMVRDFLVRWVSSRQYYVFLVAYFVYGMFVSVPLSCCRFLNIVLHSIDSKKVCSRCGGTY